METVQQRVAVVTGGNRGIGFEVAKQLGARGVHVVLTARNELRGQAAVDEIAALGHSISFAPLDVTSDESVLALAKHVREKFGRIDILINNAGIAHDKWKQAFDIDMPTFIATYETNVFGVMRVCKALLPIMVEHGYGRVVNLSSALGSLAEMGGFSAAYRSSKTAVNALTRVLAHELKHEDILINALCPGWVKTELGGEDAPRTAEEAAAAAVWLATLPAGGPSGAFFQDREPMPW